MRKVGEWDNLLIKSIFTRCFVWGLDERAKKTAQRKENY